MAILPVDTAQDFRRPFAKVPDLSAVLMNLLQEEMFLRRCNQIETGSCCFSKLNDFDFDEFCFPWYGKQLDRQGQF